MSHKPALFGLELANHILNTTCADMFAITAHIKDNFTQQADYDVEKQMGRELLGNWTGYLNKDQSIGALIVEDYGVVHVCALADFKEQVQIIMEADPDGFGDRYQTSALDDLKLLGLKPE